MGYSARGSIVNSTGIFTTTSGSLLNFQPPGYDGGSGRSASLPFGAPASTHFAMVAISLSLICRSLLNFSVLRPTPHGGISFLRTLDLIDRAHGRTWS